MGMRGLINLDDYLKESLAHLRGCFELSYKYPTVLGIYNEFKILMIIQRIIKKNFGNGKRCNDSPWNGSIHQRTHDGNV